MAGKHLDEAIRFTSDHRLDKHSFFSRWTINLTNEDIKETYASDGVNWHLPTRRQNAG